MTPAECDRPAGDVLASVQNDRFAMIFSSLRPGGTAGGRSALLREAQSLVLCRPDTPPPAHSDAAGVQHPFWLVVGGIIAADVGIRPMRVGKTQRV